MNQKKCLGGYYNVTRKEKRLIIGIIATFAIIIIVILLALLSNYIKSRHENQNHERRNDAYPEKYEYFGITMDKDGIYKLYGISGDEEEYLNVRTFYNVEDMIIKIINWLYIQMLSMN